jgi:hypothetical protein
MVSGLCLLVAIAIAIPEAAYAANRQGGATQRKAAQQKKAKDKQRQKASGGQGPKGHQVGHGPGTAGAGNAFQRSTPGARTPSGAKPAGRRTAAVTGSSAGARARKAKPKTRVAKAKTRKPAARPRVGARNMGAARRAPSSRRTRSQEFDTAAAGGGAAAGYQAAEFAQQGREQGFDDPNVGEYGFDESQFDQGERRGLSEGWKKAGKVLGMAVLSVAIGVGIAAGFAGVAAAAPLAAVIGIPGVLFAIGAGQIISKKPEPSMAEMQGLTPQQQYRALVNRDQGALGDLPGGGQELNGPPGSTAFGN